MTNPDVLPIRAHRSLVGWTFAALRLSLAVATFLTAYALAGESLTISLIARTCAADPEARGFSACVSAVSRLDHDQSPPVVALVALASATAVAARTTTGPSDPL